MISKSKKYDRKFIPITIGESLKSLNKNFLYKFGKIDYTVHAKWSDIVGKFFINHSEPIKVSSLPVSTNEEGETIFERYLHVNVSPAAAIEFQHFQDKIIEKINSYFGYKAIKGIKIHQQYIGDIMPKRKTKKIDFAQDEKLKKSILESLDDLTNKELKESIVKLGISIKKEEK